MRNFIHEETRQSNIVILNIALYICKLRLENFVHHVKLLTFLIRQLSIIRISQFLGIHLTYGAVLFDTPV